MVHIEYNNYIWDKFAMKHKILFSSFLIINFFITGCATTYQKDSFTGGFKETQLAENRFRVNFRGNAFISKDKVTDWALRRSAEVCLERGYSYFAVIDGNTTIDKSYIQTPTYATTTGFGNTTGSLYGNRYTGNTSYTGNTTFTGGQIINVKKPSASNLIDCFDFKPDNIYVYDAKFIVNSISKE